MRALFSTDIPAHPARPPQPGDEQVNCGPGFADVRAADGRVLSLAAPFGAFDLGSLAVGTHAGGAPLTAMLRYLAAESFDRAVV